MKQRLARRRKTKIRTSPGLSLKEEKWRAPLKPKTVSQEGTEEEEEEGQRAQPTLRKKKLSNRQRRTKIRNLPIRKGPSVARVARSLHAPPRRHLAALHRPSLATLTTRGLMRTDILPRGDEWMSPQRQGWRRKRKRAGRRKRKVARRRSPMLYLEGGAPGLPPPLPPPTLTAATAGRSTG